LRLITKRQAPQELGCLGCLAGCGEERALVGFQQVDPTRDVTCIAHVPIKPKLGSEERSTELRYKFFRRICAVAKAMLEIAVKPRMMPCPMRELVERDIVKVVGALESLECWQRNEVMAWRLVCLAIALPNFGAGRLQELIGQRIALIGISDAHRPAGSYGIGQPVTLIDIEDRVLPHHGY
jgi:hypothetical protein